MFKVITNIEELKGKEIKYIELANASDEDNVIITKDNYVFIQNLDVESEWCIDSTIYYEEDINKQLIMYEGDNHLARIFLKQELITKEELNNLIELDKERKA